MFICQALFRPTQGFSYENVLARWRENQKPTLQGNRKENHEKRSDEW